MATETTSAAAPGRQTAADTVYRALKRDIITLRLQPGASLTEQQLASSYHTSRVPVREACRRLQQEGLLNAIPYKGYFVNQISLKEIDDCFDLRSSLESFSVERAVERASDEGIQELVTLAHTEYTYHDWASYADFLDRNLEFHLQLATLANNDRLVHTLHDLIGAMQRFFFLGLDLGDFGGEMRSEHEELVALLVDRNRQQAMECMRAQLAASRQRVLRAVLQGRVELPIR